jgi:hypothetical protein
MKSDSTVYAHFMTGFNTMWEDFFALLEQPVAAAKKRAVIMGDPTDHLYGKIIIS